MQSLTDLEQLEKLPPMPLNAALIHEATELVHIVGLLMEEMQQLVSDPEPVDKENLESLSGFIREELTGLRRILAAAVINHELQDTISAKKVLVIEKDDNVGTVVGGSVKKGEQISTSGRVAELVLTALSDIQNGDKIALREIAVGESVLKYGFPVGTASQKILAGELIQSSNITT